jgi:hypothetical protein
VVPEDPGKGGTTTCDARSNGAGRHIEDLGDLGVVEVAQVPKHDGDAELFRQLAQRRVHVDTRADRVLGRRSRGNARPRIAYDVDGTRPACLAPALVERGVRRDAIEPRRERRPAVEAPDAARDGDHGLLSGVERVVGIAEDAPAHGMDAVGVPVEQRLEGPSITTNRECRELLVGTARGVAVAGCARQRPSTLMSAICNLLDGGRFVHHTNTY